MPVLQIRGLKKAYCGPQGRMQTVIDVPEFEVAAGQQIGLSGKSGSGKTTFLNLIAGIIPADSGRIRVEEHEITQLSEPQRDRVRATDLGYIFQTFNLLQGFTCLENVLLGMSFGGVTDRQRAFELIARVGLTSRLNHYPRQLSTGQQQRVAVARALAGRPRLVLADEPTGNLDAENAQGALTLIRETCQEQEAALVLVSHDPSVLEAFEDRQDLAKINVAGKEGGAA